MQANIYSDNDTISDNGTISDDGIIDRPAPTHSSPADISCDDGIIDHPITHS